MIVSTRRAGPPAPGPEPLASLLPFPPPIGAIVEAGGGRHKPAARRAIAPNALDSTDLACSPGHESSLGGTMPSGRETRSPEKMAENGRSTYDFIVVGAGSAGCTLAARLTENPAVRVLLLEAGGAREPLATRIPAAFYKLFKSRHDWAYFTEPEAAMGGRRLYVPRGKVLGGSSAINAMIYIRGNPLDYDAWAAAGAEGWSYAEVLPYF